MNSRFCDLDQKITNHYKIKIMFDWFFITTLEVLNAIDDNEDVDDANGSHHLEDPTSPEVAVEEAFLDRVLA